MKPHIEYLEKFVRGLNAHRSKVKQEVTQGDKGGKSGQWSARKAQMAVQEYKSEGGGYKGKKTADNHLVEWGKEDWGTKSGAKSKDSGERYLPKEARAALTKDEYQRTTAKKRADTAKGKQFSAQPGDVAQKTAPHRATGHAAGGNGASRADLLAQAARKGIKGRSRMNKAALEQALRGNG